MGQPNKFQWQSGDIVWNKPGEKEEQTAPAAADTPPASEPEAVTRGRAMIRAELALWEKKALNRIQRGQTTPAPFEADWIPDSIALDLREDLEAAETIDELRLAFEIARAAVL